MRIWLNVLLTDVLMVRDPPAVPHGGVRDQNRAHWADSHALIDDAVQVRQLTAICHAHSTLSTHMFVQFLLHTFLHLKGVEQSGFDIKKDGRQVRTKEQSLFVILCFNLNEFPQIKVRNGRQSYTSSLVSTSCPVDRTC